MDRTYSYGHGADGSGNRIFVDQNLVGGIAGTDVQAADTNSWQEEIMGVIEGAGIVGNASNLKQLFAAIQLLIARGVSAGYSSGYNATAGSMSFWRISPDGFVEQGGFVTGSGGSGGTFVFVTFPIPFPSGQAPIVEATLAGTVYNGNAMEVSGVTSTGFLASLNNGQSFNWGAKWH